MQIQAQGANKGESGEAEENKEGVSEKRIDISVSKCWIDCFYVDR